MRKIMILGGGVNQLPFIIKAKECGYYTVLCDFLPDCPGKQYSDIHYQISTFDYEGIKDVAIAEKVDGIISNSEPVLHIVSRLTDDLKLPSVSLPIMERFLNKDKMRDFLTPRGLSDVAYAVCKTEDEALAFYRSKPVKMIMKPLDSSASRGVYSVQSEADIHDHFSDTLSQNRRQGTVLFEEYIEGTEFTVDGICIDGRHTTLAISKKKHYAYNENVAYELFFSYSDCDYNYDELRRINDEIVSAAGLPFGMTHAEYKYSNGKFHLIEVAARGGGAFISTGIVPYLTKTDTVKLLIDAACGDKCQGVEIFPADARGRVAVLEFFDTPDGRSGIVEDIQGLDFLENDCHIFKYGLEFGIGDYIQPAENDSKRIGYYIAFAESREELDLVMKQVEQEFKIILK